MVSECPQSPAGSWWASRWCSTSSCLHAQLRWSTIVEFRWQSSNPRSKRWTCYRNASSLHTGPQNWRWRRGHLAQYPKHQLVTLGHRACFHWVLLPLMSSIQHWALQGKDMLKINFDKTIQSCNWYLEDPDLDLRSAWMMAVGEFNSYGAANFAHRLQIDDGTASQMYGFKAIEFPCSCTVAVWGRVNPILNTTSEQISKANSFHHPPSQVGVCELAWKMIEKHLHKHRFSDSGNGCFHQPKTMTCQKAQKIENALARRTKLMVIM